MERRYIRGAARYGAVRRQEGQARLYIDSRYGQWRQGSRVVADRVHRLGQTRILENKRAAGLMGCWQMSCRCSGKGDG